MIQVMRVEEVNPLNESDAYWTKCKMLVFNRQVEWDAFKAFILDNVDANHSPELIKLRNLLEEKDL